MTDLAKRVFRCGLQAKCVYASLRMLQARDKQLVVIEREFLNASTTEEGNEIEARCDPTKTAQLLQKLSQNVIQLRELFDEDVQFSIEMSCEVHSVPFLAQSYTDAALQLASNFLVDVQSRLTKIPDWRLPEKVSCDLWDLIEEEIDGKDRSAWEVDDAFHESCEEIQIHEYDFDRLENKVVKEIRAAAKSVSQPQSDIDSFNESEGENSIDEWFTHNDDFTLVTWGELGDDWPPFSNRASKAVRKLYQATKKAIGVSPKELRDAAGSMSDEVRDVFKMSGNTYHPAWKTMIIRIGTEYWIAKPEK